MYYGGHTGRFAGGGKFNVQNLGRAGLGGEVRGLLRPAPGRVMVIGDLAQIEARVTAWYAEQYELLAAFAAGQEIYSEFAAAALGCEVRKPGPDDDDARRADLTAKRQVGKQAVLGLGFGMGALKFMNTLRADPRAAGLFNTGVLSPVVCKDLVRAFRMRYAAVPRLWGDLEEAFRAAMDGDARTLGPLSFESHGREVRITLPSGRWLRYPDTGLDAAPRTIRHLDEWGDEVEFTPEGDSIKYGDGLTLYGGTLCENIVQATARDLLIEAVLALEAAGREVLFHVHDEVLVQAPLAESDAATTDVQRILSNVPVWATELPVACEVHVADRYGK